MNKDKKPEQKPGSSRGNRIDESKKNQQNPQKYRPPREPISRQKSFDIPSDEDKNK